LVFLFVVGCRILPPEFLLKEAVDVLVETDLLGRDSFFFHLTECILLSSHLVIETVLVQLPLYRLVGFFPLDAVHLGSVPDELLIDSLSRLVEVDLRVLICGDGFGFVGREFIQLLFEFLEMSDE
jgi:hypothetical protein